MVCNRDGDREEERQTEIGRDLIVSSVKETERQTDRQTGIGKDLVVFNRERDREGERHTDRVKEKSSGLQ